MILQGVMEDYIPKSRKTVKSSDKKPFNTQNSETCYFLSLGLDAK